MTLIYNEEQRLLQDTAKAFFLKNAPVSALRHLRDTKDAKGYSDELWQQIAHKLLHIDDPALLTAMREIWCSRMPGRWNRDAIEELHGLYQQLEHLQQQHGKTLGAGPQLPDGCFNWLFMQSPVQQQPNSAQVQTRPATAAKTITTAPARAGD